MENKPKHHHREFGLGVVIGKFLPPHAGHHHLIETASKTCGQVVVFVCAKTTDPIPGELRQAWLAEEHPEADIRLIDDRYDENDSKVWAVNTLGWLGRAPDGVFTSESYGDGYAAHMGCRHILVDQARITVPCSGTAVRANPMAMWQFLRAGARSWFALRVVVLGAESTGSTTLAMALAEALDTLWVPEYGREYSEEKLARGEVTWTSGEFLAIAREQMRREDVAARSANRILVGDTNAFATCLWHRRYLGYDDPELDALAARSKVDLYILTGDEIPFVQDGLRDGEHIRHDMHLWFESALENQSVPWIQVRGAHLERLATALAKCRDLRDCPMYIKNRAP